MGRSNAHLIDGALKGTTRAAYILRRLGSAPGWDRSQGNIGEGAVRLGVNLGYWGSSDDRANLALAQEADRLGYAVVWAAEAYGSDAPTVLAFVAARTERIDVGSAVMQIPARTPACTAMTAATLDTLSGGRFRLGLGLSGPQVSEGWHGVRFDRPLARTREYVDIVRKALRRERLTYNGEHWTLPLPDGSGKALQLTIHPVREQIPVYLAAMGPNSLELTGEIADGWLAMFFSPHLSTESLEHLRAGRTRAGLDLPGLDVAPLVPVSLGEDLEACAAPVRAYSALYIGGMGSREQNFYHRLAVRMGFEQAARQVQELFLDHRPRDAAAAVPLEFVDTTALIGPKPRVVDRLGAYAAAGVTTLSVAPFGRDVGERLQTLRTMSEAVEAAGLAE
jgi:F420-dependent oxidoreductase-like protein